MAKDKEIEIPHAKLRDVYHNAETRDPFPCHSEAVTHYLMMANHISKLEFLRWNRKGYIMTRTNYIMSLKDIHCDIQSFHYFTFYADDVAAGLSTEQEAYASGLEYADDIVWGMKYESLLIDLIDCGAVDYEDLFWTVVSIHPSAYTDNVRSFAEYCGIFTESPLQSN